MTIFSIAYKDLKAKPLTAFLNLLLIAFGIAILTVLLLGSTQISDKLEQNSRDIDLVVGAKGSPLQLILSSIFYIDFPTGNIPLKDAEQLAQNPLVKRAVPLALGDNYNGYRIAGTDTSFINLYQLSLQKGRFWQKDFEVAVGQNVAAAAHLQVGSHFFGAHGLTGSSDIHKSHAYIVVGILKPQHNVTDNLVLTGLASIWRMHEKEEPKAEASENGKPEPFENGEREITSLLIQYRSPMSVILILFQIRSAYAQQTADDHNRLITPLWEMIAFSNYRHTYDSKQNWVPIFKPELKAFDHKLVLLPGYIIAVKAGMMHDLFMLSVLPVAQCAFCGAGSIPAMVEVHMRHAIEFTDHPVEFRGKLVLNSSGNLHSEFYLMDAEMVRVVN